jgi:ATP-dependent protease ClpP protease subunit
MSNKYPFNQVKKPTVPQLPTSSTLLDKMVDGREFESLLKYQYQNLNFQTELKKSIAEIKAVRGRQIVCYVANVVKPSQNNSIEDTDDLPFNEMISSLPQDCKEIDFVIVTPGGFAHQVANFVNKIRPKFENISFILLNKAMSAGTIFIMAGDEIIMTNQSQIGPIDPQVRTKTGEFVPAQSILTLINDIRDRGDEAIKKGAQPTWADLQILRNIDPKEIGNALNASNYSIQLVEEYLYHYKFKNWNFHSDGTTAVTPEERKCKANEIAKLLCDHSKWKNHGHAITREAAWDVCKLKITHSENIPGLDRAMRRMWALFYWVFENTLASKIFISENYCIMRASIQNEKK